MLFLLLLLFCLFIFADVIVAKYLIFKQEVFLEFYEYILCQKWLKNNDKLFQLKSSTLHKNKPTSIIKNAQIKLHIN